MRSRHKNFFSVHDKKVTRWNKWHNGSFSDERKLCHISTSYNISQTNISNGTRREYLILHSWWLPYFSNKHPILQSCLPCLWTKLNPNHLTEEFKDSFQSITLILITLHSLFSNSFTSIRSVWYLTELCALSPCWSGIFLNGVCRHELFLWIIILRFYFLNGVCRHEHADWWLAF